VNHTAAAARIATGSAALARRIGRGLTAWAAAARRDDLTGWQAALGPILRTGLLLAGAYTLLRIVRALPVLLWILAPAWLIAAYRAAPPPAGDQTPPTPAQAPGEDPPARRPADPRTHLLRWLLHTINSSPGIHLRELYPAMRQLPGLEGLPDTALRAALTHLGISPVRSLRIGSVAGRSGIRRTDIEALLPPPENSSGDHHEDAGQSADSPPLSTHGEPVKSA
jgi:hypothetical protein